MEKKFIFFIFFLAIAGFSAISQDEQHLYRIKHGDKWGFMNREGKIIIPPIFEDAYIFSDGLAPIKLKDRWGCIKSNGKIVVIPKTL